MFARTSTALAGSIALVISLAGCTEEIGSQPARAPQTAAPSSPPPSSDPIGVAADAAGQRSTSALGAAKGAAQNVVDDAQRRSEEIAGSADEIEE